MLIVLMILLKLIVEPEKIKPLAFALTAIIFAIGVILMLANYTMFFFNFGKLNVTYNYWNLNESGLLIGIALFSFESINTVINGIVY